jgi:hypothetical protein
MLISRQDGVIGLELVDMAAAISEVLGEKDGEELVSS